MYVESTDGVIVLLNQNPFKSLEKQVYSANTKHRKTMEAPEHSTEREVLLREVCSPSQDYTVALDLYHRREPLEHELILVTPQSFLLGLFLRDENLIVGLIQITETKDLQHDEKFLVKGGQKRGKGLFLSTICTNSNFRGVENVMFDYINDTYKYDYLYLHVRTIQNRDMYTRNFGFVNTGHFNDADGQCVYIMLRTKLRCTIL